MLRPFSIILDFISTIFAVLSPIAIIHWLLLGFDIPAIAPAMAFLSAVFAPLNAIVDTFHHFEPIHFQGRDIPISQGILAVIMTSSFFVTSFVGSLVKGLDRRIDMAKEAAVHQAYVHKIKTAEKNKSQKVLAYSKALVLVQYDFEAIPKVTELFLAYSQYGGVINREKPDWRLIEFPQLNQAISFATALAEGTSAYYVTLRPIDPQPPIRITMHVVEEGAENIAWGLERCQILMQYVAPNQILFSQEVHDQLVVKQVASNYKFSSLGFYAFPQKGEQEIFQLTYRKAYENRRI